MEKRVAPDKSESKRYRKVEIEGFFMFLLHTRSESTGVPVRFLLGFLNLDRPTYQTLPTCAAKQLRLAGLPTNSLRWVSYFYPWAQKTRCHHVDTPLCKLMGCGQILTMQANWNGKLTFDQKNKWFFQQRDIPRSQVVWLFGCDPAIWESWKNGKWQRRVS